MKYNIIYADPPWNYNDKGSKKHQGAEHKYPTMSLDEICCINVNEVSADNSFLFLWVTWPQIFNAKLVIESWGFEYKTLGFIWVKTNKKNTESLFWGMGNWTRSNSEICLLGIKGKPKRIAKNVHSVVRAPIMSHSEKPQIFRDKIIDLCGNLPRLEMFARKKVDGWDVFGNEIENDCILNWPQKKYK